MVTAALDVERSEIEPGEWLATLLEQVVGHFLRDELKEESTTNSIFIYKDRSVVIIVRF